MIQAVTIDFWGTLVFDGPGSDDHYRERRLADFEALLGAAGLGVSSRRLARGYERSGRELARVWAERRDVPVERHVTSILEGAQAGLSARVSPEVLAALVEAYARPATLVPPRVDPGAAAGLRALTARGLLLAVVSNTMRTPGTALRVILARYGLLEAFAALTFSDELGVRKPAPEIFHRTLARLGVEAAHAVHVGDDGTLDVEGARGAGLRAVQVVPEGKAPGPTPPDLVIGSLAELPGAVRALDGGS